MADTWQCRYHPDGSGRFRGESPAAFKKRQEQEKADAEMTKREEAERQRLEKQETCSHYSCQPTEWHWSGAIRVMYCPDCELSEYRDDPNGDV